ncbi:MAG: Rpn family recombination-promoting nuclease/putative transposase [Candidatus Kapabacteria bacterium]|jgi:predicted transposase/invertase (TIGR01784 family)|nr:Rpn family recombination-promoting nuclease/putative transposase [Candidatus Kapabacteria bacterium]
MSQARYINPYTDFGFKKLFGEDGSKELLIDFLNQLLPPQHQIADVYFRNTENSADTAMERKAVFDIYCVANSGERFIVEMQKAKVKYFKDRALFYTTYPIREQAEKGNWDFRLQAVYFIAILDFEYDEEEEWRKFRRDVCLKDQDGDVFFNKLHFRFLQMPLFTKQEHELETKFDKWCFFLKNLANIDHIPTILNEPIFQKAFQIAEIANLSQEQRESYEMSLLQYWDWFSVWQTALEEQHSAIARATAKSVSTSIAQSMKKKGYVEEEIAELTGLSPEQIANL